MASHGLAHVLACPRVVVTTSTKVAEDGSDRRRGDSRCDIQPAGTVLLPHSVRCVDEEEDEEDEDEDEDDKEDMDEEDKSKDTAKD